MSFDTDAAGVYGFQNHHMPRTFSSISNPKMNKNHSDSDVDEHYYERAALIAQRIKEVSPGNSNTKNQNKKKPRKVSILGLSRYPNNKNNHSSSNMSVASFSSMTSTSTTGNISLASEDSHKSTATHSTALTSESESSELGHSEFPDGMDDVLLQYNLQQTLPKVLKANKDNEKKEAARNGRYNNLTMKSVQSTSTVDDDIINDPYNFDEESFLNKTTKSLHESKPVKSPSNLPQPVPFEVLGKKLEQHRMGKDVEAAQGKGRKGGKYSLEMDLDPEVLRRSLYRIENPPQKKKGKKRGCVIQ